MVNSPIATFSPAYSWAYSWKASVQTPPKANVPRERLRAALEEHFDAQRRHGPIALLVAPEGYGKSALLAQWARTSPVPAAWYTLDETDNDLAFFLRGVTCALNSVIRRPRWRSLLALDHLYAGIPTPADRERLTNLFLHDVQRVVSHPLTLILTNLHTLQPGSATARLLQQLLAEQPDLLGLALESRTPWEIRTATARQEQRILTLDASDLALRDDEFTELLALSNAACADKEMSGQGARCGGAIMTAMLYIRSTAEHWPAKASGQRRDSEMAARDALARRAIAALPANERSFAAQVAILDPVTPPICRSLLDLPDTDDRLVSLAGRLPCFEAVTEGAGAPIYRFQPAVRVAALRTLGEEQDVAEIRDLHARAGDIQRDAGDYDAAVDHYAAGHRFDRIIALIDERQGALLSTGMGETIIRWIQALPEAALDSHPRLLIVLADLLRHADDDEHAVEAARRACDIALTQAEQEPELAARALLARGMASFEQKEYERASDDCARALSLAPADAIDLQIQARFDLIQCCDALGRLERHSDLLSELEQRAERARDVATLSRYWYLRSKAHEAKLRHVASASACERALRCAQEAEDTETAALSQVRLGMMLACEGNYGEALKLVNAAREQARRAGYSRTMAYAVASVGDIERMRGAYDSAIAGYYRAQTLTEPLSESRLLAYVLSGLAYTYILNGRSDLAVSLLRDGYEQEPDPAESTGWARKALALGLAYLREGEPANAAEPIERAYALAPSADDPSLQLDARLILSALLLAQRRDAEANAEIAAALNALAVEDVVPVLLPTVQTVSEILPLIERSRGERAAALLAALARVERSRSREEDDQSSPTAPDMRLFAFGGARVFDGRVQVGGWRLPAALELMCYLLDRQEPVAKETILADLWPGKTEQNANLNFRQAVFQLNRTLDRKTVVKRDRRWTLAFDCWVDTREFERLYMDGVRMEDAGDARSAQCAFRRALTYYCGPYLADVDSPWALQRAEEFASTYRSCLDRLAALEEQFGRYEDAAQRWFQLLASAASHESARRGLMRHYARQREYENARDQYARLRHALGPERAPTAETQALYDELVTPATAHDA